MDYIFQILLALALGGILGAERAHAGKAAGLRTYMLVTLAATVFIIIAQGASVLQQDVSATGRIISQIILGIGFLGAGIIFYHREHVRGLTTAASLWIATGIGVAVGVKMYMLAVVVTTITFIILAFLPLVEDKIDNDQ